MRAAGRNGGRPFGYPKPDLAKSRYNLVAGVSSRRVSVLPSRKPSAFEPPGAFRFLGMLLVHRSSSEQVGFPGRRTAPCSARYLLVVRTTVDFSKQAPVPKHTCPARQRHSADRVLLADCRPQAGVQLPRKGERSFRSAREECTLLHLRRF